MFESKHVIKSNIHEYLSSLKFWIPIRVDDVFQEGAIGLEEQDPVFLVLSGDENGNMENQEQTTRSKIANKLFGEFAGMFSLSSLYSIMNTHWIVRAD